MKNTTKTKKQQADLLQLNPAQIDAFASMIVSELNGRDIECGIHGDDVKIGSLITLLAAVAFESNPTKRKAVLQSICETAYGYAYDKFESQDALTTKAQTYVLELLARFVAHQAKPARQIKPAGQSQRDALKALLFG